MMPLALGNTMVFYFYPFTSCYLFFFELYLVIFSIPLQAFHSKVSYILSEDFHSTGSYEAFL